jgi:hypothetical protein
MDKSKYQLELEALPEWVQKMVLACQGMASHSFSRPDHMYGPDKDKYTQLPYALEDEKSKDFSEGMGRMMELARCLSAPWPPPAAPEREKRAFNVVELMTEGDEGGGFNQPCAFGCLAEGHAVYCHNTGWPDSPRKCRRTWYTGGLERDEDCPGFVANPDYKQPDQGAAK